MDAPQTFQTSSRAAQALGIPPGTLLNWERRGVVGPFARDSGGRRLLTEADIQAVRDYMRRREVA